LPIQTDSFPLPWRSSLRSYPLRIATGQHRDAHIYESLRPVNGRAERWLGKFGQRDKWIFCLTAARMAADQEREHVKATGRDINNRTVSFALQALKKRGLVKNTDGKWAAPKARARRAPSLSGVSADEIKAAA
jgi:hypothetical protein